MYDEIIELINGGLSEDDERIQSIERISKKIKHNRINIFFGRLGNNSLKFIYFETAFFIKMSKIN